MQTALKRILILTLSSFIGYFSWSSFGVWGLPLTLAAYIAAARAALHLAGFRTRDDIRLMEVAAFGVFLIDVVWISLRENRILDQIHSLNADFPISAVGWAIAATYFSSLLRLFLWEWHVEVDTDLRGLFRRKGVPHAVIDASIRLSCWFLLLYFPVYLGSKASTPWPEILGSLQSLTPPASLLAIYGLFVIWDLLGLWWKDAEKAEVAKRLKLWLILDLVSCVGSLLLLMGLYVGTNGSFMKSSEVWFSLLSGIGVAFFVVITFVDVVYSKYWKLVLVRG